MHYSNLVEVGCREGRTTGFILENVKDSRVIAVDPWRAFPTNSGEGAETYEEWDFEKIKAEFWKNVGAHLDRVTQIQDTSLAVAAITEDASQEIVFIDAAHDYKNCLEDIRAWWPKVRPGGCLCGHDYQHTFPGVMRAVAESFNLATVGVGPDSMWYVVKDPQ